jgi:hypothetical protein
MFRQTALRWGLPSCVQAGILTCVLGLPMTEISRFFRVPLEQIVLVRAIVEGHEGLAQVRSQGPFRGEIELVIPEPLLLEAEELILALQRVTGCVAIEKPADWTGTGTGSDE